MNPRIRCLATLLAAFSLACPLQFARAQVPPHPAGSICFTPNFWCWAPQKGSAGTPCSCPSPYGQVTGRLG